MNSWLTMRSSGYWAFLDFALAFIPIDMVWKLQMNWQKKFWLSCLLGMGVLCVYITIIGSNLLTQCSAGTAAAVKTSKVPITVKAASSDITCESFHCGPRILIPVLIHIQGKPWNYSCGTGKPNFRILRHDKLLIRKPSLISTRIPLLSLPASVISYGL